MYAHVLNAKIIVSLQIICVHTFSIQTCMQNAKCMHSINLAQPCLQIHRRGVTLIQHIGRRTCVHVYKCCWYVYVMIEMRVSLDDGSIFHICVWFSLSIALCTDVKTRRSAWRCPRSIYQHMINRSTEYSLPTHLVRNDFNSALARSNNKKIVNSNSFQTMN